MKTLLKIKDLPFFLFLLGVFFMPFNSYEGIAVLGEFKRDSCVLFFLLAGFFVFIRRKIAFPISSQYFNVFLLILVYFLLTGLLNIYDINDYYFKATSGVSRFLRQYVSLIISSLFSICVFYNILKKYDIKYVFLKIRKVILYSLIIVSIYSTLEFFIVKLGFDNLLSVIEVFNYFPFTRVNIDWTTKRMSSVTFESPALATYLLSISGWMFSYLLTEKKGLKKYLPILFTIILCFLSGSRAGFFIILVQILVFVLYTIKDKKYNRIFVNTFLSLITLGTISFLVFHKPIIQYTYSKIISFKTDDEVHALSNKSRFGIQYAMFQVFLKNPIKGTGYGLQAFESKELYPDWAVENNWEFRLKYLNEEVKSFPPGYNIYLRLLSETGIIGFMLFVFFLFMILLWCYNKAFIKQGEQTIIPLVITISMVGFVINWLKVDTFRIYFFWVCFVLIIMFQSQIKSKYESKKNNNVNSSL
ncbi:hypothetical protein IA57_05250 [Mangrovimonas yunxiaonensis]|uniref:O-antigen ligase-related domain-containing protein n=1 Tax=Mangrovimonas yunxiaonensis TaxID=1197477 RepID=A0A084TKK2_9FLAO|nr:O-antigen ligase family protein [Mangrovimonas yunxiaonensis]KFB01238.1 hypothetical protein IA57_05250 [Mangrovimonas yunxiaonensis]GGH37864.1 hypothetical protein GCM10011364_06190 [Mangrovimonas yunxiaonensis]